MDVTARKLRPGIEMYRVISTAMNIWRQGVFVFVADPEHIADM